MSIYQAHAMFGDSKVCIECVRGLEVLKNKKISTATRFEPLTGRVWVQVADSEILSNERRKVGFVIYLAYANSEDVIKIKHDYINRFIQFYAWEYC